MMSNSSASSGPLSASRSLRATLWDNGADHLLTTCRRASESRISEPPEEGDQACAARDRPCGLFAASRASEETTVSQIAGTLFGRNCRTNLLCSLPLQGRCPLEQVDIESSTTLTGSLPRRHRRSPISPGSQTTFTQVMEKPERTVSDTP